MRLCPAHPALCSWLKVPSKTPPRFLVNITQGKLQTDADLRLPSRLPCLSVDVMLQAPAVAPQQGAAPALGVPRQQQPGQERALQVTTNSLGSSLVDGSLEMFQFLPYFVPSPGRRKDNRMGN